MIEPHLISGNKRIVGFLRYSVVSERTLRGWRNTRGASLEDACRTIFDEGRLAARAALFEAIPLPCFKHLAANGPAFELCVMVSPLMPRPWRERLDASVADLPFVRVIEVAPDQFLNSVAESHAFDGLPPGVQVVTTFRIDDDDCVFADYMATLRRASTKSNAKRVFSFNNGYYAGLRADGSLYMFPRLKTGNAWGLAFITRTGDRRTIFTLGNHSKIESAAEIILDQRPHAWLRSIHDSADTFGDPPVERPDSPWLSRPAIDAIMEEHFPFLDPGAVENAYRLARETGS